MDIVVPRGELRDVSIPSYHHKGIFIDVTTVNPQATLTDLLLLMLNRTKASTTCIFVQIKCPSYKLTTLAVESFGCLRKSGTEFIDQLATSIVGRTNSDDLRRKGIVKEHLHQMISVTTQQVIIFRRVERYRSALGAQCQARRSSTTSVPPDDRRVMFT